MKILLACLVLIAPAFARAESRDELKKIDAAMHACLAHDDSGNHAVTKTCASAALNATDKLLTGVYQSEIAKLKQQPEDGNLEVLKRLQSAQRAWVTFRDANGSLHGIANFEGSGESLEIVNTKLEMTRDRVLELDELLTEN
jgi:uncharacterized protein YecT (DUF1311 family)